MLLSQAFTKPLYNIILREYLLTAFWDSLDVNSPGIRQKYLYKYSIVSFHFLGTVLFQIIQETPLFAGGDTDIWYMHSVYFHCPKLFL